MKIPKGERKKLNKENKDWKIKAVSYSCDILLGNPIVTYYDKNSEIVNCQKKDRIDEEYIKTLKKN